MNLYDCSKIKTMLKNSLAPGTVQKRGKILEDLACYLFEMIPGIEIAARNTMNVYNTEEIDVSIWNNKKKDGLHFLNDIFLIECKNWSSPVTSIEVNWFATKIEDRGLDFGVLLATNGITHEEHEIKRAQRIQTNLLKKHIRMIVLTGEDIVSLASTDDMVLLIKRKICELVVNG